jgi:hypothetical protein
MNSSESKLGNIWSWLTKWRISIEPFINSHHGLNQVMAWHSTTQAQPIFTTTVLSSKSLKSNISSL